MSEVQDRRSSDEVDKMIDSVNRNKVAIKGKILICFIQSFVNSEVRHLWI